MHIICFKIFKCFGWYEIHFDINETDIYVVTVL